MPSWGLAALAAVVVLLLLVVVLRQRSSAGGKGADGARLDTVAAWPPTATRILTTAERSAYGTLVNALPGYMILAQVPLARFLRVPTRYSYSEWLRRLGTQCADLVVCDMASEVLAVVNVQAPAGSESERARKRLNRMARVLKAAGIPTKEEYVARYCELTGRAGLPELDYYFAYNAFRLAGILQGIVGRVRDGTASNAAAAENEARVAPLAKFAYDCARRAGMPA